MFFKFLQAIIFATLVFADVPACTNTGSFDADFIVIGAGAGGGPLAARLAENGFQVLVIEAGDNTNSLNTTLPAYFGRATEDPKIDLAYTVEEFTPQSPHSRQSWYPRAQGLGGSTIHNALINIIAETRPDFDYIATLSNDSSWSRDSMQAYMKKIEHNLYAPGSPDHGYTGWLSTSLLPLAVLKDKLADPQLLATVTSLTTILGQTPILDLNVPAFDGAVGLNIPSFTINGNHVRSSAYNRLVDAQKTVPSGRLTFALKTLATKLVLCQDSAGKIAATGVEVAKGASLPVFGDFTGKQNLSTQTLTAKYEVIVSAGAFQSPQLLMLSGIGDSSQLSTFGIETVVDLPGVGTNLQDHNEVAFIWRLKNNFTIFDGCTWLYDPAQDPCLAAWYATGHQNFYAFSPVLSVVTTKTKNSPTDPSLLIYFLPAYFKGFIHGFSQQIIDNPNVVTAIVLQAHPASQGSVRLTGSHPQDLLKIEKAHFESPGGQAELDDLVTGLELARQMVETSPLKEFIAAEIFPEEGANLTEHVYEHVFGHHACCTNPMGSDTDPDAVLDSQFRVRGVENLRVVDMSSWRNVPGYFVTTPMYMASEKVADMIITSMSGREALFPDFSDQHVIFPGTD